MSLAAGLAWAALAGAQGAETGPYFDPAEQLAGFQISDEIEVTLFASEPDIANPIQMTIDPEGRVWVICSWAYPQITPGEAPNDKLIVLEDTDGDGRADKSTVFADGLLVPTGFELGDGGAYVANQPELLHFRDTDGDLVADERRVVLSGFGTEDNHHAISAWRWSPGGDLHFQSGIFLHTQVETPHGLVTLDKGGIFSFRPRGLRLSVYATADSFANPWGHAFDRWGQNFLTEAPGGHIYWLTPVLAQSHGTSPYPRIEGAPKSCGVEFFSGPHWPEDWQGDMILNAFKAKQVLRYKFSGDSSGFTAKEMEPLIISTEPNFRPVDVKQGLDGAMYVADWFNPIIGHMQYNFRDPRRDKHHGRIWRITYKGRPLSTPPKLTELALPELLDHLKSDEDPIRHQVRRLLYEMDPAETARALDAWITALDPGDAGYEHHRLEALWAFQTIDVPRPELLAAVLESPDPRARAAAVRVLLAWRDHVQDVPGRLADCATDPHPRVRAEAVAALSHIPEPASIEAAAQVLDQPMDRYLEYGLTLTARALQPTWLPALEAGELTFGGDPKKLGFVLRAAPAPGAVKPLLNLVQAGTLSPENRPEAVALVAGLASAEELDEVFAFAEAQAPGDPALAAVTLAELARAATVRDAKPEIAPERVAALIAAGGNGVRAAALRLAGAWQLEPLRGTLESTADAAGATLAVRQAAIDGLAGLGGDAGVSALEVLAQAPYPAPIQMHAASALAALDVERGAASAAAVLVAAPADADPSPLLGAYLRRRGGADALGAALSVLGGDGVEPDVAKLALRYMHSVGREDAALASYFNKAAGLDAAVPDIDDAEVLRLAERVAAGGNPAHGERLFRQLDCFKCHAIAGAGGQLGPDLAGLGASAQVDYLIEAVLAPNKAVREGYEALEVSTKDWDLYTGIKIREDRDYIVLRDAIQDEIQIAKRDIEESRDVGSLMPVGLLALNTEQEVVDLVRFISELGKPGAYATPNVPIVRRWRVLAAASDGETHPRDAASLPVLDNPAWLPAYSEVSGALPIEAAGTGGTYVAAEVEVTTPGKIELAIDAPAGTQADVGRGWQPLSQPGHIELDAERGIQPVILFVPPGTEAVNVSLRIQETASSARAFPLGGR